MTEAQEMLNEIYDSKLLDREAVIEKWLTAVRGRAASIAERICREYSDPEAGYAAAKAIRIDRRITTLTPAERGDT